MNQGNTDFASRAAAVRKPVLSIIIPCYNEQENVSAIYMELKKYCKDIRHEIIFVNDGSTDNTENEVMQLQKSNSHIHLLSFVKNANHQIAIRAGLRQATGDSIITMDADLQHPPMYIPKMLEKAGEGFDIVNMKRTQKQKGFRKRFFSKGFYWVFNHISDIKIEPDIADFRLISRRVVNTVNTLPERNLVLRVVLPHLGFRSTSMEFNLNERKYGDQSYSFLKSWNLAYHSIFNFTTFPLDIGFKLGILVSLFAFLYAGHAIYSRLFTDLVVPGYTDIIASVLLLGGVTLVYVGILGKYLSVIVEHLKERPEYILKNVERPGKKRNIEHDPR